MSAVEILSVQPATDRARHALEAFTRAAKAVGIGVVATQRYAAAAPWLLFWGPGAPDRAAAMRQHVDHGGHVIALDLAYWNRNQKVRVSFDAPHPQAVIMARELPKDRLGRDKPLIGSAWNAAGPVIIAGIGRKAQVQYGSQVQEWETAQTRAATALGRKVVYRPKPKGPAVPIESALAGASAVVTWHSNVAVDAIRMGIPAVCRDGAAAAVCPASIEDVVAPLEDELRLRFLRNLAWFQWAPESEGPAFWAFVREQLA